MTGFTVTTLHVERGLQMRTIVQDDIVKRGYTFEGAVENLAKFLGVDEKTVELGIAIANDCDRPVDDRLIEVTP